MGDQRATQTHTIDRPFSIAIAPKSIPISPIVAHPMLKLQRQIGNRAVTGQIQAKMTVGRPNDTYEQEADRVANTVMRMPDSVVQRQPEEKKDEHIQAKENAEATPNVVPQVETRIQSMRGGGQALPDKTRGFFESRMGYDFSGVRIHADSQAGDVAGHLNAQAFAIGQDVFFNTGRYEPQTDQGKWLLAHELTHTVQQKPTTLSTAQRKESTTLSLSPQGVIRRKISAGSTKAPSSPAQDPAFQAVVKKTKAVGKQQKKHDPAKAKATEAQAAAVPPANDIGSKAAGKQVGQMDQQQPKAFDRKAFKAALLSKIAATAPKNLKEADEFKESGKVGTIKGDLTGQVDSSKQQSGRAIVDKVKGTPDSSGIPAKAVAPLPPNAAGMPPGSISAEQAIPKPKTESEVSLQAGSQSLDQQMADADVSEEQLKKSNEPDFQSAVVAKQHAQKDSVTAPQHYRQSEQGVLTQAQSQAVTIAKTQLIGMHGIRGQAQTKTTTAQQQAKAQDEQKRAEVANELQTIYTQTKKAADDRLTRLDAEVNQTFDQGATQAQQVFEAYVTRRMDAYKDDRYGGFGGGALWLKDKLLGLPSAVNAFYQEGRQLYIAQMDAVLDRVAFGVEKGLNEAKAEITKGKKAIEKKLNDQPEGLRKALQADAQKIQGQFDQLEQSVEDKQNQLLDSLTQKYNEKLQSIDARIDEMKAANRGLVDQVIDAVGGVIKAILQLKDLLFTILAKVASAIKKIIKDPIGFLGNLVAGVKQGFMTFVGKIGEHLQKGIIDWLFGALADSGIQLPESFDLKGIISLVLQILGLTYTFFRARAVTLLGERVVKTLEMVAEPFKILMTQGPGGLWEYLKDQLSNLKDVILDGIKSFVTESIIKAGVTWIIGLLNPAGAFIKACKAIYDIVMFFVERGSQIIALVNAVVDSVSAIADGAIGVAASAIENALAKALPVVISFLAALLGVTGITEKIRAVIAKVEAPVHKAIDWLINKAVGLVKAAGKFLGLGKGKKDDKRTENEKKRDLELALREAETVARVQQPDKKLKASLAAIKAKYDMTVLEVVIDKHGTTEDVIHVHGEINPTLSFPPFSRPATGWKLAPGGLTTHEGKVLVSGKGVHVFTRHGTSVTEAEMEADLQKRASDFTSGRIVLERYYNAQVSAISNKIKDINANMPVDPTKLQTAKDKIVKLQDLLNNNQTKYTYWKDINLNDRAAVAAASMTTEWRSKLEGGPRKLFEANKTRFNDDGELEGAVLTTVKNNETNIDTALTASPTKEVKITSTFPGNLGIGYELDSSMNVVKLNTPLTKVSVIIRASDVTKQEYMVETAWPHT